jgi:TatD DNase family protein
MWIDTHCHPQIEPVIPNALNHAVDAGVDWLVCVGTDAETSRAAIDFAVAAGERVKVSIGLHPHDAKQGLASTIALLDEQIANPDGVLVGIGECGLDYFYEHSSRDEQKKVFAQQIELANRYDLTLIVHTRDAWKDTWEILRSEGVPPRTVIHCFTGGPEEMQTCLDLGTFISFSGIVTFPKATEVQEAARICPIDRMVIETDSPFLAPVPHRGKPNEPAKVGVIGKYISELKDMQVEMFAKQIYRVSEDLFNLRSL